MNQLKLISSVRWVLLSITLLVAGYAVAQRSGSPPQAKQLCDEAYNLLFIQGKDSLALQKYQAAKALYVGKPVADANLVDACFGIGIIFQMRGNNKEAISAYKESIAAEKEVNPRADSSLFYAQVLIAENFIHLNHYDSAYAYYEKAGLLLARYPHIPQALRFYNGMGSLYYLFGNYAQSTNYYEKVLKALSPNGQPPAETEPNQVIRYVMYSNNIASAQRKLGLYQAAIDRLKNLTKYGILSNILYQNIASAYLQLNQPGSARTYLQKINMNADGAGLDVAGEKIDYYNSYGTVYLKTKEYKRALASFDKARQISLSQKSRKNDGLATAFAGKAQVYEAQKNYLPALEQYQLALQALHFTFNKTDIYQNPRDYSNIVSPLLFFQVLKNKAQAFRRYFDQTQQAVDLETALKTYQLAFQTADRIRKGYDSDEAKLFFTDTVAPTYEEAIATAFQLYGHTNQGRYLETAFALAEQSKAAVLAESLRELELKKIPGISKTLLRREADLKRNNAALYVKLVEDTVSSARKEMYRDYIRENEIKLAKIYKAFEKNKQYYGLRYDTKLAQVSALQKKLDAETAVLEYFIGQQQVYVFVVTQSNFTARQIGSATNFTNNWHKLYTALYQATPGFRYQGNNAAHQLYRQLLAPVVGALAGKSRLLIIPDKALCYLPFEALVSDLKNTRYLLQDYTTSYAYSAKFLRPASETQVSRQEVSVLAMAPFGSNSKPVSKALQADLLAPLLASADEVNQVGGRVYIGKEATKERLQKLIGNYNILHLATHAKTNNQVPLQSYIAFYQANAQKSHRLYVSEIYNLPLRELKLVVLSACETGNGKLVNGEGIMSLARAFAYAGCPSIITTLWQAEDNATAYITTRLHTYLKQGKPIDEAVRSAKFDYIASQPSLRRQSPVYWANFISIGEQVPVYPNYSWLTWVLGGVVAGVLASWLLYQKRKRNKYEMVKA